MCEHRGGGVRNKRCLAVLKQLLWVGVSSFVLKVSSLLKSTLEAYPLEWTSALHLQPQHFGGQGRGIWSSKPASGTH